MYISLLQSHTGRCKPRTERENPGPTSEGILDTTEVGSFVAVNYHKIPVIGKVLQINTDSVN